MYQFTLRLGFSIRPCAAVSAQLLAQMQHCALWLGLITGGFTLPCLQLLTQTQHSMWLLGLSMTPRATRSNPVLCACGAAPVSGFGWLILHLLA